MVVDTLKTNDNRNKYRFRILIIIIAINYRSPDLMFFTAFSTYPPSPNKSRDGSNDPRVEISSCHYPTGALSEMKSYILFETTPAS